MDTYIEDISVSYGESEAKQRIERWRQGEGKDFKVEGKGPNWVQIKHKTMHFIITLGPYTVKVEAWVGGRARYSISPNAIVGAVPRRHGWKVYTTLKDALLDGSNQSL